MSGCAAPAELRYTRRWWHRWEVVTVTWLGVRVEPHAIAGHVLRRKAQSHADFSCRYGLRSEVQRVR